MVKLQMFGTHRDSMLRKSLDRGLAEMEKLQGPDRRTWSWGRLHVFVFAIHWIKYLEAHRASGSGPVPRPGDEYTVNATGFLTIRSIKFRAPAIARY